MNFGEVRRAQLAKSLSSPPRWCFWNLLRSFKVCSDAEERESGVAESNGNLPYLFISSKTAILVPEFAVEDLPSGHNTHDDDTISIYLGRINRIRQDLILINKYKLV